MRLTGKSIAIILLWTTLAVAVLAYFAVTTLMQQRLQSEVTRFTEQMAERGVTFTHQGFEGSATDETLVLIQPVLERPAADGRPALRLSAEHAAIVGYRVDEERQLAGLKRLELTGATLTGATPPGATPPGATGAGALTINRLVVEELRFDRLGRLLASLESGLGLAEALQATGLTGGDLVVRVQLEGLRHQGAMGIVTLGTGDLLLRTARVGEDREDDPAAPPVGAPRLGNLVLETTLAGVPLVVSFEQLETAPVDLHPGDVLHSPRVVAPAGRLTFGDGGLADWTLTGLEAAPVALAMAPADLSLGTVRLAQATASQPTVSLSLEQVALVPAGGAAGDTPAADLAASPGAATWRLDVGQAALQADYSSWTIDRVRDLPATFRQLMAEQRLRLSARIQAQLARPAGGQAIMLAPLLVSSPEAGDLSLSLTAATGAVAEADPPALRSLALQWRPGPLAAAVAEDLGPTSLGGMAIAQLLERAGSPAEIQALGQVARFGEQPNELQLAVTARPGATQGALAAALAQATTQAPLAPLFQVYEIQAAAP